MKQTYTDMYPPRPLFLTLRQRRARQFRQLAVLLAISFALVAAAFFGIGFLVSKHSFL